MQVKIKNAWQLRRNCQAFFYPIFLKLRHPAQISSARLGLILRFSGRLRFGLQSGRCF